MTFTPRIDMLPPAQRALWPELEAVPRRYVLYGGTALALQLAHRTSIDSPYPAGLNQEATAIVSGRCVLVQRVDDAPA